MTLLVGSVVHMVRGLDMQGRVSGMAVLHCVALSGLDARWSWLWHGWQLSILHLSRVDDLTC